MKIALLARNSHLYSHRRIVEAARAREHDIEITTLRVSINITSRKPALYYRKRARNRLPSAARGTSCAAFSS